MDARTGMLLPRGDVPTGQKEHFVGVERALTAVEKLESQIKLYSLCVCGSGKKFKFCCKK